MYGSDGLEAEQAKALLALDDGAHGAVLELDDLGDLGQRADRVQLGRVGDVLAVGLALRHQRDGRAVGDRLVERLDRLVAADLEGHDHLREDDRLAQRDERRASGAAPSARGSGAVVSGVLGGLGGHRLSCWVVATGSVGSIRRGVHVGRGVLAGRSGVVA